MRMKGEGERLDDGCEIEIKMMQCSGMSVAAEPDQKRSHWVLPVAREGFRPATYCGSDFNLGLLYQKRNTHIGK